MVTVGLKFQTWFNLFLGNVNQPAHTSSGTIQAIEGQEIRAPQFSPQNPFRDVPIKRIGMETYLLTARQIIGNQTSDQTRTPGGAEKLALLRELEQCRGEVRRIIASLDREIEELEARERIQSDHGNTRQVVKDRDCLRAKLQFYIDITEALNYNPTRATPEE